MDWLFPFYISATIFGVGITIIDLLGLIGHHGDQADHDADHDGGHDMDHAADHDGGHDMDHDANHDGDHQGEPMLDTHSHPHDQQSVVVHDHEHPQKRTNPVIFLLSFLRSIVYFCLGFGPVGWFGLATGMGILASLAWSVPFGLAAVFGTRALRRFMRKDLDSQVKDEQLMMEKAEVLVSINKGQLGKVRVRLGDSYIERYARAADAGRSFTVGTTVSVVEVTDEYLIVDDET